MIYLAPRASSLLYNYLISNPVNGYYLLPFNICPIVPLVFRKAKISFKFIDIELETFCIDRNKVLFELKNQNCNGLLLVYTYGLEYDFNDFFKEIKVENPNFHIIEDKCLNKPSFSSENKSQFSDLILYSTGYGKYLDLGYGGFAILNPTANYNVVKNIFNKRALVRLTEEYNSAINNDRLIEITNENWLDNKKPKLNLDSYKKSIDFALDETIDHKKSLNSVYNDLIPERIILKVNGKSVNDWRFNIKVKNKKEIMNDIFLSGLFASSHYKPLDGFFYPKTKNCPNSQQLHHSVINLFNDKYFETEKATRISKIIKKYI